MKEETAVRKSSKPFVKMENGTRAQFRGTKPKSRNKIRHTTQAGFHFFFFLSSSCKRSFFYFLFFCSNSHRIRSNHKRYVMSTRDDTQTTPPRHQAHGHRHTLLGIQPPTSRTRAQASPARTQQRNHQHTTGARPRPLSLASVCQGEVFVPNKPGYVGETGQGPISPLWSTDLM